MRYFRIFLLHLQNAFELRSLSVVWLLITFLNVWLYLLFWQGSIQSEGISPGGMTLADISTYYLLLMITGSFIASHVDEDIAYRDIKQGLLVAHLMRPFSYFKTKFLEEIPWRIIQGTFGIVVFVASMLFFHINVRLVSDWQGIVTAATIVILAYGISFLWSMILGLSALWITEYSGLQQLSTVVSIVLAGYLVPVNFLPDGMRLVADVLPFSYMAYYPIRAAQGALTLHESLRVMGVQTAWFVFFVFCLFHIWKNGIKRFTGVGQ
ncbi:MAG: ABC transporter permease [Candidatus Gottesmanbacteria bacterium]|nr:ABC transporter permease [Candidatus Gottesmanbacteria bacterium]